MLNILIGLAVFTGALLLVAGTYVLYFGDNLEISNPRTSLELYLYKILKYIGYVEVAVVVLAIFYFIGLFTTKYVFGGM